MKTKSLPIKSMSIVLALAGFALNTQAIPSSIAGSISFSGTTTMDTTSFMTATKFVSFQTVTVGAESALSGNYVGTSGAAVTVTPFTWSPPTASTPINPLWTFVSGGLTYSFDLSVLHMDFASPTGILLSGTGTAHITGFTDTVGHWDFSAQSLNLATFTFSSTTTVPSTVPDGGTTAITLGASFLGMCLVGFKTKTHKV
jgi:uncharacterized membrane protein